MAKKSKETKKATKSNRAEFAEEMNVNNMQTKAEDCNK